MRPLLILSSLLFPLTLLSQNLDIRVDYGSESPTGGNWNNVTTRFTDYDLVDFNTGLDTGINASTGLFMGSTGVTVNEDWLVGSATTDYVTTTQHSGVVTLFDEVPDGLYTLELAFMGNFALDQLGAEFTVGSLSGPGADRTYQGTAVPAGRWNARSDGFEQTNWLIFDDVAPNASGEILVYGQKTPLEYNSIGVNAIRLTAVPEPAAYAALFGLVALGLAWFKRRNLKSKHKV